MPTHAVTMLGAGLIGEFYTRALHAGRGQDRVATVYSRSPERARAFAERWGVARHTADLRAAIEDPATDTVVVGLPNACHEEAVALAARAGKAVLCTKPLGRTAAEARRMLEAVEGAGVFHGYLEDLVYTPKHLKAVEAVRGGAVGDVLWVRSREAHPGPHSAWFWSAAEAGGGALADVGCHCAAIVRAFMGRENRPVEVMCWADTLVHPIDAEDHAIALIRFESGAMGQIEASWAFRGGMDVRDEVAGTAGTILLNHSLRTGFELFTVGRGDGAGNGYVGEKLDADRGWLFPVGDEVYDFGYVHMFADMFGAMDAGRAPAEDFYEGYVVNAVLDACYASARSRRWEPVQLDLWRAPTPAPRIQVEPRMVGDQLLVKEERMPDGTLRQILRDATSGAVTEATVRGG